MRYRFAEFELCTDTRRLTAEGDEVHIEPQVYDVLVHLVVNRSRVASKEDLLDTVWGSRFVSESALTSRIKAARAAVGDDGRSQEVIRTAHGHGYQFVAEVEELASVALPAASDSAARLPSQVGVLHGRIKELQELGELSLEHRLVTLLGPGGVGKTRLSVELGHSVADFDAVFVDLAAVRDGDALGDALALALGVEAGMADDITTACTQFLTGRRTFLIVDNCEHVADAAAQLIARILNDVAEIRIVATSRVPLDHAEEVLYRLSTLPTLIVTDDPPAPEIAMQNAAVALFCDRARRVQHDFQLDPEMVAPVAALCAGLDGLPLAIELAAGRLGTFGVEDLVARLDRRLDLLGSQRSGRNDRHRTLRVTLNWSYELLPPSFQQLFRFMSVYPAGLPVDGVEWLAEQIDLDDDPLLALDGLVESSLLLRRETRSGSRYPMLETMRTFGIDLSSTAGELERANELAAQRALAVTAQVRAERRNDEGWWNDRVRQEVPNIREARIGLAQHNDATGLLAISADLHEWGEMRDVSELWTWADELAVDSYQGDEQAQVLVIAAQAAWRRGRIEECKALGQRALDIATEGWSLTESYSVLGVASLFLGNLADASRYWDARAAIDGDPFDTANAALGRAYAGQLDEARNDLEALLERVLVTGHALDEAWCCYILGEIAASRGDDDCVEWLTRAVSMAEELGAHFVVGVAGLTLCTAMDAAGDRPGAARRCSGLVDHWLRAGSWTQLWTTLRNASMFLFDADPTLALALLRAADADPFAPGVEPATAEATTAYMTSLEERADGPRLAELLELDRARLADTARIALAAVS